MVDIKEKYRATAVIYDNIWMYFTSVALDLVLDCKANQIKVWRLEAFTLSGQGIQPSMEHSITYKEENGNWDQALEFLSDERHADYLYEVFHDGY